MCLCLIPRALPSGKEEIGFKPTRLHTLEIAFGGLFNWVLSSQALQEGEGENPIQPKVLPYRLCPRGREGESQGSVGAFRLGRM
jgi:hypothetical protein